MTTLRRELFPVADFDDLNDAYTQDCGSRTRRSLCCLCGCFLLWHYDYSDDHAAKWIKGTWCLCLLE